MRTDDTPIYDQMVAERFSAELADLTAPDADAMLTAEDTTAERGGNPLVAASLLGAVGLVLGLILAVIL